MIDCEVAGIALVDRHFSESAELALIAVQANRRGAGIGATLINAVQDALIQDGCRLLQVHTVGSSFEDDAYAQTRAFYHRSGFLPLQEFNRIDWDGPTLVLVKPLGTRQTGSSATRWTSQGGQLGVLGAQLHDPEGVR